MFEEKEKEKTEEIGEKRVYGVEINKNNDISWGRIECRPRAMPRGCPNREPNTDDDQDETENRGNTGDEDVEGCNSLSCTRRERI